MNLSTVEIEHGQLTNKVKVKLAKAYVTKHGYEFMLNGERLIIKSFKSESAADRVKSTVLEILNNMCENLCSDAGMSCSELYNCCDCGGSDCGCAYCSSCNSCDFCLNDDS